MTSGSAAPVPAAAAWLGGLGLIPFLAGAAGVWVLEPPHHATTVSMLCAYAAVILSFMGAIHWGLALRPGCSAPGRRMTLSVVPALLAWFALSLPATTALTLMAFGFIGVYIMDAGAIAAGDAPGWYRRLRVTLTTIVLLALAAAIVGLMTGTAR